MRSRTRSASKNKKPSEPHFHFRLYVTGQSTKSLTATSNLRKMCNAYIKNRYRIELIDLAKNPALAFESQIKAVPTLVRALPIPIRRIIGDLSRNEQVLVGLDIESSGKK